MLCFSQFLVCCEWKLLLMSMCVEATRAKLVYVAQAQKLSWATLAPEGFFFSSNYQIFYTFYIRPTHFISNQHQLLWIRKSCIYWMIVTFAAFSLLK